MSFRKTFVSILLILLAVGAANAQTAKVKMPKDKDIRRVAEWLTGSFHTFAQVDSDEEGNTTYRHIRATLHVQPVAIAGMDANSAALYIENAAAESRQKPYRQRVYVVKRNAAGKIIVEIHRIKNQEQVVNAYKNPALLSNLSLANLTHEAGCDMTFERVNAKLYKGAAGENGSCKSTLRGATHTKSQTELTPTQITNLDQGFDDAEAHKWGPPPGTIGHIFIKKDDED